MSKTSSLSNEINKKYIEASNKLLSKVIIKYQNEYQKENYPDAEPDTSMTCVFCGGSYTKRNRHIHNRTNKHSKKINSIKKKIFDD